MPNTFAFIVVFSWPLAVYLLFRWLPRVEALGWSILGGYLLLPTKTGLDLPLIPVIDKDAVPVLSAAIMLALGVGQVAVDHRRMAGDQAGLERRQLERGALWPFMPILAVMLISPIITVITNSEPLVYGPVVVQALRIYDSFSIIGLLLITVLPFFLAVRFFASPESHVALLKILTLGMLVYSLPMLLEVRLSPQFNLMIFGFFPHDFLQHMRGDGFRPVVFLHHGLWLAILMAGAIIAAASLWRQRLWEGARSAHWLFAMMYLLLVLSVSNSLGALAIAAVLTVPVLVFGLRSQVLFAGLISVIVLVYPVLRSLDLVPVEEAVTIAQRINAERAQSLQFRIDNEDALSARAAEKPFAGWGMWGRNQIYDPETGDVLSVTDGSWILIIGTYGWLGYIAQFGLLTLPTLLIAFGRRSAALTPATAGLTLVLGSNLLDLLPNATLTPITWMIGGALAGFCVYRAPSGAGEDKSVFEAPKRSWAMLTDRPRQPRATVRNGLTERQGPAPSAKRLGREEA